MLEKGRLAAAELTELDIINQENVASTIQGISGFTYTRLIVVDQNGKTVYDSYAPDAETVTYALLPEVYESLSGNDVFSWNYHDGAMQSKAAVPIYGSGALAGCVYIMEHDTEQGALIQSLQNNIFVITCVLEIAVIIFSLFFSRAFTGRLRKIMESIRIIRAGDYSHRVHMPGSDELSVLGKEFNDLTERLESSEKIRSSFVSDASHELKTPLASIKLLTDSILQNDVDMETTREFVADIGNEADRLNRMSQKLLSLSKVDAAVDSECEIVHIGPTVKKVLRMLSANAGNNQITIEEQINTDSPILIQRDDLYQIVFNLVENGIKYNVSGGKLTITLDRKNDNAVLRLKDTGVGIPQDSLDHIFDRFYRVDKARSRKSGGSGLGLSIVRSLVERNNGQITVNSEFGKGTVFTVTFPVFDTEVDE